MNDQTLKPSIKNRISDLIATCDFAELYRKYAWKRDVWQNGFPDICRLERGTGDAARAGTLSEEHLKAIARWGGLPGIERIRALAPIRIALFEDGKVARWVRENPENAIRVLGDQIRGFGPTYTSNLLRFAAPELFGAIDTRIVRAFGAGDTGHLHLLDLIATPVDGRWAILSGQQGWPGEYGTWTAILSYTAAELNAAGQPCPHPEAFISAGLRERGIWLDADVEMAFFNYASGKIQNIRRD
ncbi:MULTISPECIES: hypothetical protein [Methanoculleus]|nr:MULTISPECIES: hypothetical protein [Methanoculleus]MCC7555097.1 hypothetical protein [Methanoculleus marisnigri]UYU18516.1 hypothetical protein OH143_00060 [Methanoculleus submarinus]